jgi:hypothetical protein
MRSCIHGKDLYRIIRSLAAAAVVSLAAFAADAQPLTPREAQGLRDRGVDPLQLGEHPLTAYERRALEEVGVDPARLVPQEVPAPEPVPVPSNVPPVATEIPQPEDAEAPVPEEQDRPGTIERGDHPEVEQADRVRREAERDARRSLDRDRLPVFRDGEDRRRVDSEALGQQMRNLAKAREEDTPAPDEPPPSVSPHPRGDIAALETGVSPAYLLGDIDESGVIDGSDLALLDRLLEGYSSTDRLRTVSCAAAADMDMDGDIDTDDRPYLESVIDGGSTASGILYDSITLPCRHTRTILAFRQEPVCERPLRIQILEGAPRKDIRLVAWGTGEVVQLPAWSGWRVAFTRKAIEKGAPAIIFSVDDNLLVYWLSSFCALERNEQSETDWAVTAGYSSGRPTPWGEEIDDLTACPHEDKGCEALIVDLLATSDLWQEPDASKTRDALKSARCNVVYSAPRFAKVPTKPDIETMSTAGAAQGVNVADRLIRRYNAYVSRRLANYEADLARVLAANKAAWTAVQADIAAHRANVRKGVALAFQLVNAHGSESTDGTCGVWGVGYDTGTGTLTRDQFLNGNYKSMRGNTCTAVMEDRSCYSGLSANGMEFLNNLGLVNCTRPPRHKHEYHAAFFDDIVMSASSATSATTMLNLTLKDYYAGDRIRRAGRDPGYRRLAQSFLVEGVGHDADGYYRDAGYNKIPGKMCGGSTRRY